MHRNCVLMYRYINTKIGKESEEEFDGLTLIRACISMLAYGWNIRWSADTSTTGRYC